VGVQNPERAKLGIGGGVDLKEAERKRVQDSRSYLSFKGLPRQQRKTVWALLKNNHISCRKTGNFPSMIRMETGDPVSQFLVTIVVQDKPEQPDKKRQERERKTISLYRWHGLH
jgi:hypothetical protein